MIKWALPVLLVLTLGRIPLVPAALIPTFQPLPQKFPQATPCSGASKNSSATEPSTAWSHPSPVPRPGPRITLSLDVPLGLQKILLEQARARASRKQAVANAHILAQVGRR